MEEELIPFRNENDKWGYKNKKGEIVIEPQFDYADDFSEGLAAIKIGGKWGYINKEGKYVINPEFDKVDYFSEGLAAVKIRGKWGYINTEGKFVIEPKFDWVSPFSKGLAEVKVGDKNYYINKKGEIVLLPSEFKKLPEKICILDIETEKTNFKYKWKSKLGIAGVRIYNLKDKENIYEYEEKEYKCFLSSQLKELEIFLSNFNGLIIGFNILDFDYGVLESYIKIGEKIKEKTVDIFYLLLNKLKNKKGLSLNRLSQLNLGRKKRYAGKKVEELLKNGELEKVIDYNKNDCCELTKDLWWLLVSKRKIKISESSIEIDDDEFNYLIGKNPDFCKEIKPEPQLSIDLSSSIPITTKEETSIPITKKKTSENGSATYRKNKFEAISPTLAFFLGWLGIVSFYLALKNILLVINIPLIIFVIILLSLSKYLGIFMLSLIASFLFSAVTFFISNAIQQAIFGYSNTKYEIMVLVFFISQYFIFKSMKKE